MEMCIFASSLHRFIGAPDPVFDEGAAEMVVAQHAQSGLTAC
jgi:hypothetical protein